jgi:hypothetical protein
MNNEDIITRFLALTLMYIHEEKNIEFYAGKMNVEADNLDKILIDVSGKGFPEWIAWLDKRI